MKVKICGITNIEDAILSAELGADMLGFIFYPQSKRYISPEKCKDIIAEVPTGIKKVGVFVNDSYEVINRIVEQTKIDVVQLHGDETTSVIHKIKADVIKAFRVSNNFDFAQIEIFKKYQILLDSSDANNYGGTGKTFHWDIIPEDLRDKIILAGGISVENIEYVFDNIYPLGVDLSSSLEISPGKKDPVKLKDFFAIIKKLKGKNVNYHES
ncbi:MAG: phosphoribosylanthranilate isomerase [Melioribacteraceae bacterium]|nr:phosphoribosylanthranilate isomerase [Melioribacteraceae bacterium]